MPLHESRNRIAANVRQIQENAQPTRHAAERAEPASAELSLLLLQFHHGNSYVGRLLGWRQATRSHTPVGIGCSIAPAGDVREGIARAPTLQRQRDDEGAPRLTAVRWMPGRSDGALTFSAPVSRAEAIRLVFVPGYAPPDAAFHEAGSSSAPGYGPRATWEIDMAYASALLMLRSEVALRLGLVPGQAGRVLRSQGAPAGRPEWLPEDWWDRIHAFEQPAGLYRLDGQGPSGSNVFVWVQSRTMGWEICHDMPTDEGFYRPLMVSFSGAVELGAPDHSSHLLARAAPQWNRLFREALERGMSPRQAVSAVEMSYRIGIRRALLEFAIGMMGLNAPFGSQFTTGAQVGRAGMRLGEEQPE